MARDTNSLGGNGGLRKVEHDGTMSGEGTTASPLSGSGGALTTDYFVTQYGATGDGVTDDATAIQSCIDAAITDARRVYFPPGTYIVATSLTITAPLGLHLFGMGDASIIKFDSVAPINGAVISATSRDVCMFDLHFVGSTASNDKNVNTGACVQLADDVTDTVFERCTFENACPVQATDSLSTVRMVFRGNYIHNSPNGLHPPSWSTITDSSFICDEIDTDRAQAIYSYGQQVNISILNNKFKNISTEDIQIRASNPRWDQRNNFRIIGNHFENSHQYSIWVGSDDHPDIGEVIIEGNTFTNCSGPIMARGVKSGVIANNHFEHNWEWPHALGSPGADLNVVGGVGAAGQYQTSRSIIVTGNKFISRHPWVGKITIDSLPSDGDTLNVSAFDYTWRTSPSVEGDVQIGVDTRACAENLAGTLRGLDGRMTAPNNVIRYSTDVFNNTYGSSYGESNDNVVGLVSAREYEMSSSTGSVVITAPQDYRGARPIEVVGCVAPQIVNNTCDDYGGGIAISYSYAPVVKDNTHTCESGVPALIYGYGNVFSVYEGNRLNYLDRDDDTQGRLYYDQIYDAFPIVDNSYIREQQLTSQDLQGKGGLVNVGDGKAFAYFWFGPEFAGYTGAPTRPYRWDDGDTFNLYLGGAATFTFKRSSPGAGQFNDADSLIALINAIGGFTASYVTFENSLGSPDPKFMMKIVYDTIGTTGNDVQMWVRRFKKPGDTTTWQSVPQSLLCGKYLTNNVLDQTTALFRGGYATLEKTFVQTPLANKNRPIIVTGIDAASHALDPVVYRDDITPGVGFLITHGVAAGTEKFLWKV